MSSVMGVSYIKKLLSKFGFECFLTAQGVDNEESFLMYFNQTPTILHR